VARAQFRSFKALLLYQLEIYNLQMWEIYSTGIKQLRQLRKHYQNQLKIWERWKYCKLRKW
jgi:hypothetical protein